MKKKKNQNRVLLLCSVLLLLILLVLIIIACGLAQRDQAPTVPTTAPTVQTTAPTEESNTDPTTESTTVPTTQPTEPVLQENPYTPEDFGADGDFLTCLAGESLLGIDVSAYQPEVNWQQVKSAGVEFVMLRAGFRGYGSAGNMKQDAAVLSHYNGAKQAGLKVGVYFFSQAVSVQEAIDEANFLLNIIGDFQLDMPVAYDWEYISDTARTANMDADTLTQCADAFCRRVQEAGFQPMIYISENQNLLQLEQLARYPLWVALYDNQMTYPYKTAMWQYTNKGSVPGVPGNADINLWLP